MTNKERMKNVLDAIISVRGRATIAMNNKNFKDYSERMFDLIALENCLVTEALLFFKEEEKLEFKKAA